MSSAAYARIHLILAFLGLYVAGMLSMSHILGMQLPCGIGSGCDIVTQDPRSKLLGIPFAYYGVAGYGIIALVALVRIFSPPKRETILNAVGYALSSIGLAASIGLTIFSLTTIHAVCTWCIASAITMSLLFAFYAFAAAKPIPAQPRQLQPLDVFLFMFGVFALLVALMFSEENFQQNANTTVVDRVVLQNLKNEELAPLTAHRTGPANAKFTVVMFGDLTCGACEHAYGELTQLMKRRHDFQVVFRHLPLEFHPLARPAANLSELAAEKGKFWAFTSQMYNNAGDSTGSLIAMASALGVDNAAGKMSDPSNPAVKRVEADLVLARRLGLHTTPSIFLLCDGYFPEPVSSTSVERLMDNVLEQDKTSPSSAKNRR